MPQLRKLTYLAVAVLVLSSFGSLHAERRVLTGNIAEYSYTLRVGPGPYDEIGIHRIVKELAPNHPARTNRAVFMAPGDIWNFRAASSPARIRCLFSSPRTASMSGASTTAGRACRPAWPTTPSWRTGVWNRTPATSAWRWPPHA